MAGKSAEPDTRLSEASREVVRPRSANVGGTPGMMWSKYTLFIVFITVVVSFGCTKKPMELTIPRQENSFKPVEYIEEEPVPDEVIEVRPVFLKPATDRELQAAIDKARKTLPTAKERFIKGFPPGQIMQVTTLLTDDFNNKERVFIKVNGWEQNKVSGKLSSTPHFIEGFHIGQDITVTENLIIDWTITHPNGSEEGNFVGKVLNNRNPE